MKKPNVRSTVRLALALAAATLASAALTQAAASSAELFPAVHFEGLLNDYTPSAAVVKGGPYEMRGKWQLEVDPVRATARFSASLNMETSDYGITQGSVNKDDPTSRGAHTHHISVTDGVISEDWQSACPAFSPAVKEGFVVTGTATITGNGVAAPFGNPSPVTICVLGGDRVHFSNLTMTLGSPANTHFGKQAVHGVVSRCSGPWGRPSSACALVD